MIHQLILERSPETFHQRVLIAVAFPTHGRGQAQLDQVRLIVLDTIMSPGVGGLVSMACIGAYRTKSAVILASIAWPTTPQVWRSSC